jgi:glycine/D-amino acid oxidase-like deaminating enzyme
VFDIDETWMHKVHLYSYLGIESIGGTVFMEVARKQVDSFGVDREEDTKVTSVSTSDGHFTVTTEDDNYDADYVILATGAARDLAEDLGYEFTDEDVVKWASQWRRVSMMSTRLAQWSALKNGKPLSLQAMAQQLRSTSSRRRKESTSTTSTCLKTHRTDQ